MTRLSIYITIILLLLSKNIRCQEESSIQSQLKNMTVSFKPIKHPQSPIPGVHIIVPPETIQFGCGLLWQGMLTFASWLTLELAEQRAAPAALAVSALMHLALPATCWYYRDRIGTSVCAGQLTSLAVSSCAAVGGYVA